MQMFGSQFAPVMATQKPFPGKEVNQDLQRTMSVNSTINDEAPHKSPTEPSTDNKQEEGSVRIHRITKQIRKTKIAKSMETHKNEHILPANNPDPLQRWKSQRTLEEPWVNIGQVQMYEARSKFNGGIVSEPADSNAATKGSFEADELR